MRDSRRLKPGSGKASERSVCQSTSVSANGSLARAISAISFADNVSIQSARLVMSGPYHADALMIGGGSSAMGFRSGIVRADCNKPRRSPAVPAYERDMS